MDLSPSYWSSKYNSSEKLGWDVGYSVPAITSYIDQIEDKSIKILVPGAGIGWEAEYIFKKGFSNVYYMDFVEEAIVRFRNRVPEFPINQIFNQDFFDHIGKYDLIIEHTFFSSIPKTRRKEYVKKMDELIIENGKLVGLMFNHDFGFDYPPFGGSIEEYYSLFKSYFNFKNIEIATNSIKPRIGRELFINFIKKPCL